MLFLQNLYASIYRRIEHSTEKISGYKKEIITVVLAHVIAFYYLSIRMFSTQLSSIGIGEFDRICFFAVLILAISIFAAGKHNDAYELNRKTAWIYSALSICLIVSVIVCRFIPERNADIFVIILLVPIVIFMLKDEKAFYRLILKIAAAFVNIGVILHVLNLLFARQTEGDSGGYQGLISNPNTLAMVLLPTLFSAIFLYSIKSNKKYYLFVVAYTAGIIVMTQSRTSFGMAAIGIICWAVFSIRYGNEFAQNVRKQILAVVLLLVVMVAGIFVTDKLNELVAVKSDNQTATTETEDSSWDQIINKSKVRMDTGLNGLLSGRVELWKYYTEDITVFGHDSVTAAKERENDGITLGAHNTLIYYLYTNGASVALFMLFFQAAGCIYVITSVFRCKDYSGGRSVRIRSELFASMIIPAYCAGGLVEELSRVGGWGVTLIFYLAMTRVFIKKIEPGSCREKHSFISHRKGRH